MITKQLTFNNFCDFFPEPRPQKLEDALKRELEPVFSKHRHTIILKRGNIIEIEENRCKDCGAMLYYNGYNARIPIIDKGIGRRQYRVHRKRCPNCGEIPFDLHVLAPKFGQYHENYLRRARQHYMNGQNPARIRDAMRVDFGISIPRTTIMGWVIVVQIPLRELLSSVKLPLSGNWHHDETFGQVRGKKAYAFVTIDAGTGFVPAVTTTRHIDRSSATRHLLSIPRDSRTQIRSIVTDGTNKLGTLFKTRSFKQAQRGQCCMHVKWRVGRKLKRLAGLGESTKLALPKEYHGFRQLFYNVIDSHDETQAYVALERLRPVVEEVHKPYLTKLFKDIEAKLPQIIAWQRNPAIAPTNNKCENFNQRLQYHGSFETRSMSLTGMQRIADFRVFKYNFERFPRYADEIWRKRCQYKAWKREDPKDPSLNGCTQYYFYELGRVNRSYDEYLQFWDQYLVVR